MSALSALQKEWVENLEEGEKTGVVLWDLSAAYDTLNISILLEKLEIYTSLISFRILCHSFILTE